MYLAIMTTDRLHICMSEHADRVEGSEPSGVEGVHVCPRATPLTWTIRPLSLAEQMRLDSAEDAERVAAAWPAVVARGEDGATPSLEAVAAWLSVRLYGAVLRCTSGPLGLTAG